MTTLLTSFAKSGNTWMRYMLAYYYLPEDKIIWENTNTINITTEDVNLFPANPRLATNDSLFVKTHALLGDNKLASVPYELNGMKVVQLIRNPLDVAVSFYNFNKRLIDRPVPAIDLAKDAKSLAAIPTKRMSIQLFIDSFLSNPGLLGTWTSFNESWHPYQNKIVVKYEDMVVDPARELTRVIEFVDGSADPVKVANAVDKSKIENLRLLENSQNEYTFFKHGKTGTYKDYMTSEQIENIVLAFAPTMEKYGYETDPTKW